MTTYIVQNINKQLNIYIKTQQNNNSQKTNHSERLFPNFSLMKIYQKLVQKITVI